MQTRFIISQWFICNLCVQINIDKSRWFTYWAVLFYNWFKWEPSLYCLCIWALLFYVSVLRALLLVCSCWQLAGNQGRTTWRRREGPGERRSLRTWPDLTTEGPHGHVPGSCLQTGHLQLLHWGESPSLSPSTQHNLRGGLGGFSRTPKCASQGIQWSLNHSGSCYSSETGIINPLFSCSHVFLRLDNPSAELTQFHLHNNPHTVSLFPFRYGKFGWQHSAELELFCCCLVHSQFSEAHKVCIVPPVLKSI